MRSVERGTGRPSTLIRLERGGVNPASILRAPPPSPCPTPRTKKWPAPKRTISSSRDPRCERPRARYCTASRKFVLPCPLPPTKTFTRGDSSISESARLRHWTVRSDVRCNGLPIQPSSIGQPQRHEQTEELFSVLLLHRAHHRGVLRAVERELDVARARALQDIEQVVGVEPDVHLRARVRGHDLFLGLAQIRRRHRQGHGVGPHAEL